MERRYFFMPLALLLAAFFLGGGIAVAQEPNPDAAQVSDNQTIKTNLLSNKQVFQMLSKSPFLRGKGKSIPASLASTAPTADSVDKIMAHYSFVWSSADGIDTGRAFLFPGADPQTGAQYVFGALPNGTIIGVTPVVEHNTVRLLDLSTGNAVELPADGGSPRPLIRQGGSGNGQSQAKPEISLPGIAQNIADTASCLWNQVTSTLNVQSWSDFANLACQIASRGSEGLEMYDFGKEVAGCASAGVADCFFLVGNVTLFLSNASCRPDWVNSCILNPPSGGGGSQTASIITNASPLSTPIPGQQFYEQLTVLNLSYADFSVVLNGPGCPNTSNNTCVVHSNVITRLSDSIINVPLTLAAGSFTMFVTQTGLQSAGWPLTVNGSGDPPPSGGNSNGNLSISFSPSSVPNAGGGKWNYTVTISETAGGPITLTGLHIGGNDYSSYISQWFGSQLPAYGRVSASFTTTGSPGNMTWTFIGNTRSSSVSWSGTVNLLP